MPRSTTSKKQPWSVDVDVHLKKVRNKIEFEVCSALQPTPGGKLVFRNNRRPGFNINFHLYDPDGTGYRFPPNAKRNDAVWSQLGSECPTSPKADVFDVKRVVEPDCMTLVVYNPNPSPAQGDFWYTLRVTQDEGVNYYPLDPGASNQNGQDN
jgi:hypothetical protein